MKLIQIFYRNRFKNNEYEFRDRVWKILCERVFQKMIYEKDTLIDIGAGYCEFINYINCKRKIAVDLNPDTKVKAKENVEVLNVSAFSIPKNLDGKIDVIFMSNFLEHLNSKNEVILIIKRSFKLLRKEGIIILMQPNIDLVKERYWDFIDHNIPLNLQSLTEALEIGGFEIQYKIKRFLPYTTKDNISIHSTLLLKLYLLLPTFFRPFAGQSLIVAKKR